MGAQLGCAEGNAEGEEVGCAEGRLDGCDEGSDEGWPVGCDVGAGTMRYAFPDESPATPVCESNALKQENTIVLEVE